jgi:Na+/H+ antiporter NhaD/arsenite permease-like protein
MLVSAAGFSSVTDNIPLAAMLSKILVSLGTPEDSSLWWTVIFGANLGGNITPIGSASTLVAVTIMHKHKLKMSFAGFVKVAAPYALLQIVVATAYVLVFL